MLALQHETKSSFDLISIIMGSTRESLRSYLIAFNTGAVREVSEGLKSVIDITEKTKNLINEATGSELCIQTTVSKWEAVLNTSGRLIASCVRPSLNLVHEIQQEMNEAFINQHISTFEGQNLVLNAFFEVT